MRILFVLLLLITPVCAQPQPQPQPPSALVQAFGQKIVEEVNANIQLRMQLIEAQAKIKELEAKKDDPDGKHKDK